jgi:hypothetical protein
VIPLGPHGEVQHLTFIERGESGFAQRELGDVLFVPGLPGITPPHI